MAGPRHVVPQGLRGVLSQEDGPRVPELRQKRAGVLRHDLQVLRGDLVGQLAALFQGPADDDAAVILEGLLDDVLPA